MAVRLSTPAPDARRLCFKAWGAVDKPVDNFVDNAWEGY
jgi:hypothetical protein